SAAGSCADGGGHLARYTNGDCGGRRQHGCHLRRARYRDAAPGRTDRHGVQRERDAKLGAGPRIGRKGATSPGGRVGCRQARLLGTKGSIRRRPALFDAARRHIQTRFQERTAMTKNAIPPIAASEITPEAVWLSRRHWLQQAGLGALALGSGGVLGMGSARAAQTGQQLPATPNPEYWLSNKQTSEKDVTTYNNFYEFGTGKTDPYEYGEKLQTRPWTVTVEGEVAKPRTFDIDDLLK